MKNGKRQSFGVDRDCFITFQMDMSSSFDKGSDLDSPISYDVNRRTNNDVNCRSCYENKWKEVSF